MKKQVFISVHGLSKSFERDVAFDFVRGILDLEEKYEVYFNISFPEMSKQEIYDMADEMPIDIY
jgi:hypothetical protein